MTTLYGRWTWALDALVKREDISMVVPPSLEIYKLTAVGIRRGGRVVLRCNCVPVCRSKDGIAYFTGENARHIFLFSSRLSNFGITDKPADKHELGQVCRAGSTCGERLHG
jgi:hypothetical protein